LREHTPKAAIQKGISMQAFSGVLTAIATPFDAKGNIDTKAFGGLLKHLKDAGTHGVVVAGTTGESPTLDKSEKKDLIQIALECQSENFGIYAGTGTNSTKETVQNTAEALEIESKGRRINGAMIVVPYYNRPTPDGQKAHFKEVFTAFKSQKFCLYNVPGRTAACLSPTTAVELFEEHTNCVAIKEAAGQVNVIGALALALRQRNMHREILSGDDATFAPALLCGATGVISVSSHIIPTTMVAMWAAWANNDLMLLQRLHLASLQLNTDLFCTPNPIGLKWALSEMGLCKNSFRLPLTAANETDIKILKSALNSVQKQNLENKGGQ
jgi:4-hydroxy-tetrahydrodipicolinate synthase